MGRYPTDPASPEGGPPSAETHSDADVLAAELLTALTSGDGKLTVTSPTERQRARYPRAIHRLIISHQIPHGSVLRHTGRDRGDVIIRLVRKADVQVPDPAPEVVVPPISAVTTKVRALGAGVRMSVTEASMERVLRILQAIANECAMRGWTLEREPTDDRRLRIRAPSDDGGVAVLLNPRLAAATFVVA